MRETFEQVPELYDRARPAYPPLVLDDLVELAALPPRARLLEIGCGTGHATVPLAERGYAVTCVELGERLADAARRKLAGFPRVEVVTADFETWRPERADFDAVVAFGAFHWVAPEVRYARSADLLREHGRLAFVSTAQVLPADGDPFFVEAEADYDAVAIENPWRPPDPALLADHSDEVVTAELAASGRFRSPATRRYRWDVTHTADEYVALLQTYSHHRALDGDVLKRLLGRIHRRIEAHPGRSVRATYLALLYVAERA